MKWAALWCFLPLAFLVQWPHWSAAQSTCLNWAAFSLAALSLSFLEYSPRRAARFPLFSLIVLGIGIRYVSDVLPTLIYTEWTFAWGTIAAFGSGACWIAMVLSGTVALVRNAPDISKWLPKALFVFISTCLAVLFLHELKLYHFWKIAENPGGFLPTAHVFADISALSLPILFSWTWWATIPALVAIVIAKSMTAMVGILAGAAWLAFKDWKGNRNFIASCFVFVLISAVFFMARTSLESLWILLSLRFHTWLAVLTAIFHNPLGIGMDAMAYSSEVVNKTPFRILPHSASDALNTILYTGWIGFPLLAYLIRGGFKHLGTDEHSVALVVVFSMSCFARVVGFPQVALVAWVVWMAWKMDHSYPLGKHRDEIEEEIDCSGDLTDARVVVDFIQGSDMEASRQKPKEQIHA